MKERSAQPVNKSSKSVNARMAALKKKLKTVEDILEAYAKGDDSTRASLRKLFADNKDIAGHRASLPQGRRQRDFASICC
jgi:hypothetical protein